MSTRSSALRRDAGAKLHSRQWQAAVDGYRQLLAMAEAKADDAYNLGYALRAQGQHLAALDAYAQALALGIAAPEEVHLNRSVILTDELRRDVEAEAELVLALDCRPGYAPALLNLGNLHEERGDAASALACYAQVVAPDSVLQHGLHTADADMSTRAEALARLVGLQGPQRLDDPLIAALRRALQSGAALPPVVHANLWFALARALDGLRAFDEAFDAWATANRLVRQAGPEHDRSRAAQMTAALMAATPVQAVPGPALTNPDTGPEPLFICGMFRSGSTLVEQVLASHPAVVAGGELNLLPRWMAGRLAPFPGSLAAMDDPQAAALATEYKSHLQLLFPAGQQARYITDKRPDNFQAIGLIKRMFPRARIVHTLRNPLDNGLSIYAQHLNQGALPYASDLGDIGHHFGQYRRLMDHWRLLYGDTLFHIDYDAFVQKPEHSVRALLDFLGLPWDERCLAFHRNRNAVKTASYWQVRQPLHTQASGRWRNYARHLAPLREALLAAGVHTEPL